MKRLQYTQFIPTSPARVWEAFVGMNTYPQWTEAFVPGAHYTGEWKTGSTVMAISPNPDGTEDGLCSTIVHAEYAKSIQVEHVGVVHNDVLYDEGNESLDWKGGKEEYLFEETALGTQLHVMMDVHEDWAEHFQRTWPIALARLSEIAVEGESNSITVYTWITASIDQVRKCYTDPKHIERWNTSVAQVHVDLKEGDVQFAQEEEYVAVRIRCDRTKTLTRQQQQQEWQCVLDKFKEYVEAQELL